MCNADKCKKMALEVQADLARESERDAKGVSWERYQAVCDELESVEYELEELKAYNMELQSLNNVGLKGQAKAIWKAVEVCEIDEGGGMHDHCDTWELYEYADKLEAGTL